MAILFDKIKRALGFYPKATYYKVDQITGEPIKVEYSPVPTPPQDSAPAEVEEPAVDNKYDGIDLAAMTKAQLRQFAGERAIPVNNRMTKQELIDTINAAI
jgi:hypothetical protein